MENLVWRDTDPARITPVEIENQTVDLLVQLDIHQCGPCAVFNALTIMKKFQGITGMKELPETDVITTLRLEANKHSYRNTLEQVNNDFQAHEIQQLLSYYLNEQTGVLVVGDSYTTWDTAHYNIF
jgi:hypothetical protein